MNSKPEIVKISSLAVVVIIALVGLSSFTASASAAPATRQATWSRFAAASPINLILDQAEATYQGARIVHNVTVNGQVGMRVHANFTVKYALDTPCQLIAYFYYDDQRNTPLKAGDPNYRSKDGKVSSFVDFTPAYDPALYKDLQIFVPYNALNMESGEVYDLKFYLALYQKNGRGRFFGKSGWYKFQLTMP